MKSLRRLTIVLLVILAMHIFVPLALAHPLGNFTINHYAGLQVTPGGILVDYVLDMAEIPAFQEIAAIDTDRDGRAGESEASRYQPEACETIRSGLDLSVSGVAVPLDLAASSVDFPPGQAGLLTLRLNCTFKAQVETLNTTINFADHTYPERLGWREVVVYAEGVQLRGDFQTKSLSQRLSIYPQDLLSEPLDIREVTFDVGIAGSGDLATSRAVPATEDVLPGRQDDAFTRLVLQEQTSLTAVLFALGVAFVWGGMHALTPGHGKTIVGAYLVGGRGTAKHALYLGLTTTITHTAGVFALGLLTLLAARYILPEIIFPWLTVLSGLLIVGIGVSLFAGRLNAARGGSMSHNHSHSAAYSPHRAHTHPHVHEQRLAFAAQGAASGGIAGGRHSHSGIEPHSQEHGGSEVGRGSNPDHDHGHDHDDGHTHLPPGSDGSPVTWRSLLALGISGGLLPCPSALVVLLSAITLDRVGFGLALVFVFSLGLAGALSGIGLLFVYGGRIFNRFPIQTKFARLMPAFSALIITLIGLGITTQALARIGGY